MNSEFFECILMEYTSPLPASRCMLHRPRGTVGESKTQVVMLNNTIYDPAEYERSRKLRAYVGLSLWQVKSRPYEYLFIHYPSRLATMPAGEGIYFLILL